MAALASDKILFSSRCELLVAKFGRSSKPMPRILVLVSCPIFFLVLPRPMLIDQTSRNVYIIVQAIVNNQLSISSERTISLGGIKYVSTTNLKDDWFSIVVGSQEPDPLLNCVFKTEFFTHLATALRGQLTLKIGET